MGSTLYLAVIILEEMRAAVARPNLAHCSGDMECLDIATASVQRVGALLTPLTWVLLLFTCCDFVLEVGDLDMYEYKRREGTFPTYNFSFGTVPPTGYGLFYPSQQVLQTFFILRKPPA